MRKGFEWTSRNICSRISPDILQLKSFVPKQVKWLQISRKWTTKRVVYEYSGMTNFKTNLIG